MDMDTDRDVREMADELGDLLHLDVDAVQAYNEAIERIEEHEIRTKLSTYRDDHQRHVAELTDAIRTMGQEPPAPKPDLKGMLIEGMTALRSAMGTDQALKAMRQNETITNKAYERINEKYWPENVREMLQRGLADERQHLSYIEQHLSVSSGVERRY